MNAILEAIGQERDTIATVERQLRERSARLDEIERLVLELDDAAAEMPPPVELPAPKVTAKPRATANGSGPVRALPPVLRSQATARTVKSSAADLAERARIVVALLRELEPVGFKDLLARVEFTPSQLSGTLQALREASMVQASGRNRHARWSLTETLDRQVAERNGKGADHGGHRRVLCREDVVRTVRSEPGEWSEQRLAEGRGWDREQVAEACGLLLNDNLVELCPDGTYRPRTAVAA